MHHLMQSLTKLADTQHAIFAPSDLRALVPDLSQAAFKTLLTRAVQAGHLQRLCRGLYMLEKAVPPSGRVLFHAAARLRANGFNYISLETALSAAGVISQVPMQWVSIMSSGRSNTISCGRWGSIEFVHTSQSSADVAAQLHYDADCKLFRASVPRALRDMRATHRSMDLIDWSAVHEPV